MNLDLVGKLVCLGVQILACALAQIHILKIDNPQTESMGIVNRITYF